MVAKGYGWQEEATMKGQHETVFFFFCDDKLFYVLIVVEIT